MRIIKFRVFDRKVNRMFEVAELTQLIGGIGFVRGEIGDKGGEKYYTGGYLNKKTYVKGKQDYRFKLMQYTGLKDKNGKEIYEGDICKYKCGKSEWIAEVVFHYGMFTFPVKEKPLGRHRYIHNILENELEIIGNIYENPELLEVK